MGLKYSIRRFSRRFGYDLVRLDADYPDFVRKLLRTLSIQTALDVGANEGQYAHWLRAIGFSGRILSFEPVTRAFTALSHHAVADPNWYTLNVGLGDQSSATVINVSRNGQSSSLLPMLKAHTDAAPDSRYMRREAIQVEPLTKYLDLVVAPSWLKIDVQGSELQVLEGASPCLPDIPVIQLEMSIRQLYEGSPIMTEVIRNLEHLDYQLVYLKPGFQDPSSGYMLQVDGIFVHHSVIDARRR